MFNVHWDLTLESASNGGVTPAYAAIIANSDQLIDDQWGTGPIFGGQDRHLNKTKEGMDSRLWWYQKEFANAKAALDRSDKSSNAADCSEATAAFGRGLHSYQDVSSHRPFKHAQGSVKDWPQLLGHPAWWDDYGGLGLNSGTSSGNTYWYVRNGKPNQDYALWNGGPEQVASQTRAQSQVEADTKSAVQSFKDEVRKHCYCKKIILQLVGQ